MSRIPPLPPQFDQYDGWMPSTSKPNIFKAKNDISPAQMWEHFISKRRPVIIDGFLNDPEWNAHKWTDLEYLRSTAGHVPVKIEPLHPDAGHFGTSVKRSKVKLSEFLSILQDESKAGKWYLTTQYTEDGDDQQTSTSSSSSSATGSDADATSDSDDSDYEPELDNVLPAPTNALSNDFPAKPKLLGGLVLQQCNLWLGNSKEGKSSGLHHDFHDNLYILLSGYKRFLLFPPSAHRYLHPRGLVDRVYPNGLIVYAPPGQYPSYVPVRTRRPQLPIRSDGLVPSDAARWRRKARLRVKREIDERAAADAGEGSRVKRKRKGKAKQTRAQELAEEALLQAEAELRICRMDEEGIDHEADTSDEADQDDSDPDLDGVLNVLVDGFESLQSDHSSDEQAASDDDDDDDDVQVRRLLASLPSHMKPVALQALAGDQAASEQLSLYLQSVADSSPAQESPVASDQHSPSASDEQDDASSEDEHDALEHANAFKAVKSNGASRKRKQASDSSQATDSDAEAHDESDTVESDGAPSIVKRVKIAPQAEDIDLTKLSDQDEDEQDSQHSEADQQESSEEDDEEEDDEDEDEDEDDEDEDEEDDMPAFPAADSGSEFGDVDDGEAELERLLAMAEGQSADTDAEIDSTNDEDEPQSFSRISPHVLHQCLNITDDPSRPEQDAGPSKPRAKNGRASEAYRPLPGCPPPIEVFLKPGQMLYLPASWYHEVTSSSLPPLHEQGDSNRENKVHMALNYWFHPPDALEFEPVEPRLAAAGAAQGRTSSDVVVPGLGVGIGESALESMGAGTGTHERPYRDPEVWDEVDHAVAEQIKLARESAGK